MVSNREAAEVLFHALQKSGIMRVGRSLEDKVRMKLRGVREITAALDARDEELVAAARRTVEKIRALKYYDIDTGGGDLQVYGYDKDAVDEIINALAALTAIGWAVEGVGK